MIKQSIKKDFPVLSRIVNNSPLVYLDNSATTQMPKIAIDALVDYYNNHKANVHRGVHTLSEESTEMYEEARVKVAVFINAKPIELILVKNSTEAINIVAASFLQKLLKKGDTIALSEYEHHSNLIPWQIAAKKLGLNTVKIPFNSEYCVDTEALSKLHFNFIAINHVSNFLGNINNIDKICEVAKSKNAYSFIDGAQSIAHKSIDVKKIGCDFFAYSGHKIYGPFGSGGLFVSEKIISNSETFMTGGGMIKEVSFEEASFVDFAEKFDAGTPSIADSISLSRSLKYFLDLGKKNIFSHEELILGNLYEQLLKLPDIEIYGPKNLKNRCALVSFNIKGIHSHDLASVLDSVGVAIRSGQHCTMPAHKKLNIVASARASIGLYNFNEDVEKLIYGIGKAKKLLK